MSVPHATLFLDESGRFSEPDDMRLVGGLLVVAHQPIDTDLAAIHAAAAKAIAWPVRLHALELTREVQYLTCWHATGGAAASGLLSAAGLAALARYAAAWSTTSPIVRGHGWAGKPQKLPGATWDSLDDRAVRDIGHDLFRRVRTSLRSAFAAWCDASRRAYVVAGHVDDAVPPGRRAYDGALREALSTAWTIAGRNGASTIDVRIAHCPVGPRTAPQAIVRECVGAGATVHVDDYVNLGPGVWLADSLLAWLRGPPRNPSSSILLDPTGGRDCVRVSSSGALPPVRPEASRHNIFDHFVAAVQRSGVRLGSGGPP